LKKAQGIKGTPEQHNADIKDAIADIAIFLCDVATAFDVDIDSALSETWKMVKKRDFKKNSETGGGHHHNGGTESIR